MAYNLYMTVTAVEDTAPAMLPVGAVPVAAE